MKQIFVIKASKAFKTVQVGKYQPTTVYCSSTSCTDLGRVPLGIRRKSRLYLCTPVAPNFREGRTTHTK
jgi:hypothetical protein